MASCTCCADLLAPGVGRRDFVRLMLGVSAGALHSDVEPDEGSRVSRAIGFPAVVVVLGIVATVVLTARGIGTASLRDGITSTQDLSRVLFHELLLPFEVTSILILIAILGAVALARHGHGDPPENPHINAKQKSLERMAAK